MFHPQILGQSTFEGLMKGAVIGQALAVPDLLQVRHECLQFRQQGAGYINIVVHEQHLQRVRRSEGSARPGLAQYRPDWHGRRLVTGMKNPAETGSLPLKCRSRANPKKMTYLLDLYVFY